MSDAQLTTGGGPGPGPRVAQIVFRIAVIVILLVPVAVAIAILLTAQGGTKSDARPLAGSANASPARAVPAAASSSPNTDATTPAPTAGVIPAAPGVSEGDRAAATKAADAAVVKLLSYSSTSLDEALSRARSVSTAAYGRTYADFWSQMVAPNAAKEQTSVTAMVKASGVVTARPRHVDVLAFVNQTTESTAASERSQVSLTRVTLTMVFRHGTWLVDRITADASAPVDEPDPARAAVLKAADNFADVVTCYASGTIDHDLRKMNELMTPHMRADFAAMDIRSLVNNTHVTSIGEALQAALVSQDDTRAETLVSADATVTTGRQTRHRHFRWTVHLERVDGRWLVADFTPVV